MNFLDKCPSVADYETYLQGCGCERFNIAFDNHIANCNLCEEAIEGYKAIGADRISRLLKSPTKQLGFNKRGEDFSLYKTLSYAASIVILLGISTILYTLQYSKDIGSPESYFDYSMVSTSAIALKTKTLINKSTEQFVFIDNCNNVAYNDQYLSPERLNEVLKSQKGITLIRVEVGDGNKECAGRIIESIKKHQSAPVLTIR